MIAQQAEPSTTDMPDSTKRSAVQHNAGQHAPHITACRSATAQHSAAQRTCHQAHIPKLLLQLAVLLVGQRLYGIIDEWSQN